MSKPIRILYVDDNPLERELVRAALTHEAAGFVLTVAATRAEFETQLAAHDFDLVLSDVNILGYQGLQVLDSVRAQDPHVPVVIVTSADGAVTSLNRIAKLGLPPTLIYLSIIVR